MSGMLRKMHPFMYMVYMPYCLEYDLKNLKTIQDAYII